MVKRWVAAGVGFAGGAFLALCGAVVVAPHREVPGFLLVLAGVCLMAGALCLLESERGA